MPKNGRKTGFYCFMMEFIETQSEKGIYYRNMALLQQAADPVWRGSDPSVRTKFHKIAKEENDKREKYTSFRVPMSKIENRLRLAKEAAARELENIKSYVEMNAISGDIFKEDIYLMDVNALCETGIGHVFGEMSLLRFNVRDGIVSHGIHEVINPPSNPLAYGSHIKLSCEEFALDFPDPDLPKTNYSQLLSQLLKYMRNPDVLTLYTMPEKQEQVSDFLRQIGCRMYKNGEFRVYKLHTLFFYMINALVKSSDEGLLKPNESLALAILKKDPFRYSAIGSQQPDESLALAILKKDPFRYSVKGCELHRARERSTECTLSRVKRWAFTILDSCIPFPGIEAVPGAHLPLRFDEEEED